MACYGMLWYFSRACLLGSCAATHRLTQPLQILCDGLDHTVPKDPGFILHDRPVIGRAIIVQGREIKCPETGALLDYFTDFSSHIMSSAMDGLRWLTSKELAVEREAKRQRSLSFVRENAGPSTTMVCLSSMDKKPVDKAATCFACGKRQAAR